VGLNHSCGLLLVGLLRSLGLLLLLDSLLSSLLRLLDSLLSSLLGLLKLLKHLLSLRLHLLVKLLLRLLDSLKNSPRLRLLRLLGSLLRRLLGLFGNLLGFLDCSLVVCSMSLVEPLHLRGKYSDLATGLTCLVEVAGKFRFLPCPFGRLSAANPSLMDFLELSEPFSHMLH